MGQKLVGPVAVVVGRWKTRPLLRNCYGCETPAWKRHCDTLDRNRIALKTAASSLRLRLTGAMTGTHSQSFPKHEPTDSLRTKCFGVAMPPRIGFRIGSIPNLVGAKRTTEV